MKPCTIAILIILSGAAFAQSPGLKPGLWEMKPIRQVVDGRDLTAQMASASSKMEQAMANMPPEQRKQMEAMMSGQGRSPGSYGDGARICISPAMAARDKPMVDSQGRCEPAKVSRNGDKTNFEFNCTADGRTEVGSGESTVSGDTVTTRVNMTMTDARGPHSMQTESQMRYLGPDCQGIKPRY